MTRKVVIKNFKTARDIAFPSNKINIFIGEPNTGKSNILEALSFFSMGTTEDQNFKEVFRYKTMGDFFYDSDYNKPIHVQTDQLVFDLRFARNKEGAMLNQFEAVFSDPAATGKNQELFEFMLNYEGKRIGTRGTTYNTTFRTYIFKRLNTFTASFRPFLAPPFGDNLPNLLVGNTHLRKMISDFFKEKGFRIQVKPVENDLSISKEVNEEIYSYPFAAVSETLQRIVFMMLAIESNENSILVFDEPESNTFPFYTKYIAERIALDESNQFFLTTHNPYLLMSIIEKANKDELNVFICTLKNYETNLTLLKPDQLKEALDLGSDVFYNLNNLVSQ